MKKKLLAGFMALIVLFSNNLYITKADEPSENDNMTFVETSGEILEAETIEETPSNTIERVYKDSVYYVTDNGINSYSAERDTNPNTDPNNAYVVSNNTTTQGTITAVEEMRWYAFVLNERSKATIYLQMAETLDADLYMFALNDETSQLDFIGGSAVAGKGTTEYFNQVMEAGIYFFAIAGFEGAGDYAFAFFQSSVDVQYEVNDSKEMAAAVAIDQNIIGVIDTPLDIDFYKITLEYAMVMKYSISSSKGYSLLYGGSEDGAVFGVLPETGTYKFMPGTYYFAVVSKDSIYSASDTYTIKFEKLMLASSLSYLTCAAICEEAGVFYETNEDLTVNYVNGNRISIAYSYFDEFSNSSGSQYYNISIDTSADLHVLYNNEYIPFVAHYVTSTKPINKVNSKPVLVLAYGADSYFYNIDCRGTGAYIGNTCKVQADYVVVMIDPDTGKLVDIMEYNYYYDHNPTGVNYLRFTSPYKTKYPADVE